MVLKVCISLDMEGISGITQLSQVEKTSPEFQHGRELLTMDVNAVVEGAVEGGATYIEVHDTHGSKNRNVLIDKLHSKANLVQGFPITLFEGIGERFDALFLVGMHQGIGMPGFLSHTFTEEDFTDMRVNGETVTEMELTAGPFGELGIPVALVTGDDLTCRHAQKVFGVVETVPVKKVIHRLAVNCIPLEEAHGLLREGAKRAIEHLGECKPYAPKSPFTLEIDCANTFTAKFFAKLPCLWHDGARTVRYNTDSYMDVYNVITALLYVLIGIQHP